MRKLTLIGNCSRWLRQALSLPTRSPNLVANSGSGSPVALTAAHKLTHKRDSVTRFSDSGFFHESPSPKLLIITLEPFRIFSKILGDIRTSRCTTGVNDIGGKFATGVNDTGGKLPPVSTTPVANCHRYQWHRRQIWYRCCCHWCRWHRWQIMGTISGCWHLKVNLKAKIYIYVSSTTLRWWNKIIKIFLIVYFFHLPPVSLTPVANLELRIFPRIFEKILNGLNEILWGWGETDSWKEP